MRNRLQSTGKTVSAATVSTQTASSILARHAHRCRIHARRAAGRAAADAVAGTVVVGVDGTRRSLAAVEWAADEAVVRGQRLLIVHAAGNGMIGLWAGPELDRAAVRSLVQPFVDDAVRAARHGRPTLSVAGRVILGSPVRMLRYASRVADLVVIGHDIRQAPTARIRKSVSERVSAESHCPTVTVSLPRSSGSYAGIGRRAVVGCTHNAAADDAAWDWAHTYAARHRVPVVAYRLDSDWVGALGAGDLLVLGQRDENAPHSAPARFASYDLRRALCSVVVVPSSGNEHTAPVPGSLGSLPRSA